MEILSYHDNCPERLGVWLVEIKSDGERIQARVQRDSKEPMIWNCIGSRKLYYHEASALLTLCGYSGFEVRKLTAEPEYGTFSTKFEAWRVDLDALNWHDTGEKVGMIKQIALTAPVALSTSLTGYVNRSSLLSAPDLL